MSTPFDDDLMEQLLEGFEIEARERLQSLNEHLLALERGDGPADRESLLRSIFREAHTLKGTAGGLGLQDVEGVAHRLETLFGLFQSGEIAPRPELFDLMYHALDVIGVLTRRQDAATIAASDREELNRRLDEACRTGNDPGASTLQPATAPSPPPAVTAPPPPEPPPAPTAAPEATDNQPAAIPPASVPKSTGGQAQGAGETIRVAIPKLDALMAQIGELQVTRIGAEQRGEEIAAVIEEVEAWELRWRKFQPDCRRLLGTLLKDGADTDGDPGRGQAVAHARLLQRLAEFLDLNAGSLRATHARLDELRRGFLSDSRRMGQVAGDLQDDMRRIRMRPISTVFEAFPRLVRDAARSVGKDVILLLEGGEHEMDRSVLEQVHGPLVHILRNCVDHGIESPEAREGAGKPRAGTIRLSASQRGGSLLIEIEDDGGGVDLDRVRASAVRKGLISAESAASLSDQEALWLIFRSGMSTKAEVTDLSGRGVGLDVVRESVEQLGGLLDVETTPGRGTRFSVTLPLSVATTLCLLVRSGGRTFALPVTNVIRIAQVEPGAIGQAAGCATVRIDGRPLPLRRLDEALEIPPFPHNGPPIVVILGSAEKRFAYLVDAVVATQDVVIKGLPRPFLRIRKVAGATILGSGEVVVILSAADLMRTGSGGSVASLARLGAPEAAERPRSILVADDSFTTRTLIKSILESAGFDVRAATDGLDAWVQLQEFHPDVLVTDVNMPRLDGCELTARVRGDTRLKDLPVVLVTSLDSPQDRERGIQAGADAYIIKSTFDQESLLGTVRRLI